jgi:DNA-binding response OmpR family regulator
MKILVVDDDLVLSDVIVFTLRRAGFEVVTAYDGQAGYDLWRSEAPDLLVLDIKLPRMDGLTVCKRIREEGRTPIIILSVQGADEDVVHGLETGADDYIAKPFSPTQLVARVRAVLRRVGVAPTTTVVQSGDLVLDTSRREVRDSHSNQIALTQLESRLLEALMLNSGQVLSADALISRVWGVGGADRVMLKQLVHRLRQKIEPDPTAPTYLETVPGVGYAFIERQRA